MDNYKINAAYPNGLYERYNEVEITSENIIYTEIQHSHSGVQVSNQENENQIHKKCRQVANLIREIDELNKIKL